MNNLNDPTVKIKKNLISLKTPISFIQGKVEAEDLQDLIYPIFDWNTIFPDIFIRCNEYNTFFSHMNESLQLGKISKKKSISQNWQNIYTYYEEINKYSSVYDSLQRIYEIYNERIHLAEQIPDLNEELEQIKQISNNSIYQGKIELLTKLNSELSYLIPLFEVHSEEYNIYNNKMVKFRELKEHNLKIQKKYKLIQGELFRKTNEITKNIDDLDPKIQNYFEKLENLKSNEISEDYKRINAKYQILNKETNKLKTERSSFIKESKSIKQKLTNIKNNFRKERKNFDSIQIKFTEIENTYLNLSKQIESIKIQIKSTKIDIDNLKINKNSNIKPKKKELKYSTINQYLEEIKEINIRIEQIDSKFQDLFGTSVIEEISILLNKKELQLQKKLKKTTSLLNDMIKKRTNTNYIQIFHNVCDKINQTMNHLLNSLDINLNISSALSTENPGKFIISSITKKKDVNLSYEEDLKRIEKSVMIFAFIISCYVATNNYIIPLHINKLPNSVITKQTFQKSIKIIENSIKTLPEYKKIHIILFLHDNPNKISPIIEI